MLFLLGHVLGLLAQSCGIYSKSTTVFLISALRALWSASLFFWEAALRALLYFSAERFVKAGSARGFFMEIQHTQRELV